jgi:hypothetical protein
MNSLIFIFPNLGICIHRPGLLGLISLFFFSPPIFLLRKIRVIATVSRRQYFEFPSKGAIRMKIAKPLFVVTLNLFPPIFLHFAGGINTTCNLIFVVTKAMNSHPGTAMLPAQLWA